MAEETFIQKTLDKLLEVVKVELKIPLGIADIKFPATEVAKKWWENKKSRAEVENAIRRAEENFNAAHPDNRLVQILHDFPLYLDEEYKNVIFGLLQHLDEEKITWLAELRIENQWDKQITNEDVHTALQLYIPHLRHELNGIPEFREIITARMLERIDKNSAETVQGIRRLETKVDRILAETREPFEKAEEVDYWFIPHPYLMPPNFTGRQAELQMLNHWLVNSNDRLLILRALGGFGKSSLAWRWINTHVNPNKWPKLVWWSFYEGDMSFEHFVEGTLKYLNLEIPQGQRPQVEKLLQVMQGQKILLIMDGFERALRAYAKMDAAYQGDEEDEDNNGCQCTNIYADLFLKSICSVPTLNGRVLMTTRLTPSAVEQRRELLEGCAEIELKEMDKADAVRFFRAQGIRGTHAEIEATCESYGYHPLSLRILAGLITNDRNLPGDISAAENFEITNDII